MVTTRMCNKVDKLNTHTTVVALKVVTLQGDIISMVMSSVTKVETTTKNQLMVVMLAADGRSRRWGVLW